MLPHFLGIGAQKGGTTWLYHMLSVHPGVWLPPAKELHYLNQDPTAPKTFWHRLTGREPGNRRWRWLLKRRILKTASALAFVGSGGRIVWSYGGRSNDKPWWLARLAALRRHPSKLVADAAWDLNFFCRRPTDAWYGTLFQPGPDQVAGDITPDYAGLSEPHVAHVRSLLPHAKIIFIMRDPIERTWSAARMAARHGTLGLDDEARLLTFARQDEPSLLSDYLRTLTIWEQHYPSSQIFLAFFEELRDCPEELLLRIYRFLGIEASKRYIPVYVRGKANIGARQAMPKRFASELARQHYPQLQALHARFGGYTTKWLQSAEAILNGEGPG